MEQLRILLAKPLTWQRVQKAVVDDEGYIRLCVLYEIREKGSTTIVVGFDDGTSEPVSRINQRISIQWELFPYSFKWEDPIYTPVD